MLKLKNIETEEHKIADKDYKIIYLGMAQYGEIRASISKCCSNGYKDLCLFKL